MAALLNALKSGTVSAADVTRGKAQLKAATLAQWQCPSGTLAAIRAQALLTGQVSNGSELAAAIDAITPADVTAVSLIYRFPVE